MARKSVQWKLLCLAAPMMLLYVTVSRAHENSAINPDSIGIYQAVTDNASLPICHDIQTMLSDPVNKGFGDFFITKGAPHVERYTSQFTIPRKYQASYQWVEWKDLGSHTAFNQIENTGVIKMLASAKGEKPSLRLQSTTLPLPIKDGDNIQKVNVMRIVGTAAALDNKQSCYLPKSSYVFFSRDAIEAFNGRSGSVGHDGKAGLYDWCNFLHHDHKLYWVYWRSLGGQLNMDEVNYDNGEMKTKFTCEWVTPNGITKY